jgi:hypothetical protein
MNHREDGGQGAKGPLEWEIPELIELNQEFRQGGKDSPENAGYGQEGCILGSWASACITGGGPTF